jgi:hypothetical protein
VKGLGRLTLAALATVVVAGCGTTTTVAGTPVPAVRIPSIGKPPVTSAPPTTTTTTSTTQPSAETDDPAVVVQAYFDAINARDFQRAWDLGGKNVGHSYTTFASGFATTDHDVLTIVSVQGTTVTADLVAFQTDGTQRKFHGTYTVADGVITRFSVRAAG